MFAIARCTKQSANEGVNEVLLGCMRRNILTWFFFFFSLDSWVVNRKQREVESRKFCRTKPGRKNGTKSFIALVFCKFFKVNSSRYLHNSHSFHRRWAFLQIWILRKIGFRRILCNLFELFFIDRHLSFVKTINQEWNLIVIKHRQHKQQLQQNLLWIL